MIIGLEGGMGSGKTIMMVRYLLKDFANGHKIFSNFGLRHIDYEFLNIHDLMEDNNLQNLSVGIDEITVFLDCRKSSSKMNRYISYFVLQTRKRNVNLYYTTQSFRMIDKRLLEHTEFQIVCSKIYNEYGNEIDGVRRYAILDLRDITDIRNIKIKRLKLDITPYYDFYDTNEVILPPI